MGRGEIRAKVADLMPKAQEDLAELVAIRSVADPGQFPPEECERAAAWLIDAFAEVGLTDLVAHDTPDGYKAVVGRAPGPDGAPTVLLYCHYDVQPPLGEDAWETPAFELVERNGRWFGRGAADCKGNIVMLLTALRALGGGDFPVGVKLIVEGSEEQASGALAEFVPANAELLGADAILICDAGNLAVGVPTLTTSLRGVANLRVTVRTLAGPVHSGMFGGAAPDALQALIQVLAGLHDADGNTTVAGLDNGQGWDGFDYPADQFRADVKVLPGVELGGGGSVSEMLWARPALTVLGIDCPPVVGSTAAVPAEARARVSLRVPPGVDPTFAMEALSSHLRAATPWNARVEIEPEAEAAGFRGSTGGPAFDALRAGLEDAYERRLTLKGEGGSLPICSVLAETFPAAEIMMMGVEEPLCAIHAPNESVDPAEIESMAVAGALFIQRYGA